MPESSSTIGLYAKAIASAFAAAAAVALEGMANGDLSTAQWITVAVAFIVGLGAVALVPNFPEGARKVVKAVVAAVVAGAGVLTVAIVAGSPFVLTIPLVIKIVLAILGSFGIVYAVPNAAESDPVDPVTRKIRPIRGKQSTLVARNAVGGQSYGTADGV
jgi:peptidoglycan/LPS O-acetylase OafA/YrhL